MEYEVFVPQNENEKENCSELANYLNSMFFC